MQVAAQVLLVEPSRGALDLGLGTIRGGRTSDTGALASVSVTSSGALPSGSAAQRPRKILTIAFVRN